MKSASQTACLLCLCWSLFCWTAASTAQTFLTNGVTAHRGNSSEFPENTLPAFASGIEVGVDWLELDILLTKDGQLVVIHDLTTNRTGDKHLVVQDATYEELTEVDVATDFRKRLGRTLMECPPQRIPLLKEVLTLVMQQQRTRVSIQPKTDCVKEAMALIREMDAEKWVGFNDGNLAFMSEVKRLAPEIPVFWDRGPDTDIDDDIRIAKQRGFESLVINRNGVTKEKIQKIQAAGLEAGAWTVNDRETMLRFLDWGLNRFYTDSPRLLLQLKSNR